MQYFTRKEQGVLVFLSVCLVLGIGIRFYQQHWAPLPDTKSENMQLLNRPENLKKLYQPKTIPSAVIDINKADIGELQKIPGVGPVFSKRILDFREKNGKFFSVEDLLKVKGIGKKTLEKMRPFLQCD